MKLSEIDDLCEKLNIPYAYGQFQSATEPPHLIGKIIDTENFGADNKVWYKVPNFILELTTLKKDLQLENKIQNELLKDVYWNKKENYIANEEIYNVSYYFKIREE